jgi:hypothetical protein
MIGGLSIPYATTPMNKRTGITIGGTTYFMAFSVARERHESYDAAPRNGLI